MNHLFIARHGIRETLEFQQKGRGLVSYECLSLEGMHQALTLARLIKEKVGQSIKIITSPAEVAIATATIMASTLGCGYEMIPYLHNSLNWPEECADKMHDNSQILRLINEREQVCSGLVLVSHSNVIDEFAAFYSVRIMGRKDYNVAEIPRGHAVHFDILRATYSLVP
jgi:phosphohistidine phosphatase SixA